MEIRLPEGFESREEAIRKIVADEIADAQSELPEIRQIILRYLVEYRGYRPDDLETDLTVSFTQDKDTHASVADIVIRQEGKRVLLIKCFASALVSRERHVLALARVADEYQIPLAAVTDASSATLLDVLTGKTLAEGMQAIPTKSGLAQMIAGLSFVPLPENRKEKEQRILMAFDVVKCARITDDD